jgi:hypothetical protein
MPISCNSFYISFMDIKPEALTRPRFSNQLFFGTTMMDSQGLKMLPSISTNALSGKRRHPARKSGLP